MDKQQVQLEIVAVKNLMNTLNALVTEVTILRPLQEILQTINIAVDELLTAVTKYQDSALVDYIQESDALVYLDEVVDLDPISDLEVQFFGVLENMTENELTVFLMQMLDKLELAYTQLIEKLHAINALLAE